MKQYGVSKRNALIKWCQERLIAYTDIEIKNFSSSWNDGLAFCALLHSFMPHRIDYESLRAENNPRKNFQLAFRTAQAVGIQQTLNINDLLNNERPDWNNVMNYVALIYKHFQGSMKPSSNTDELVGCLKTTNSIQINGDDGYKFLQDWVFNCNLNYLRYNIKNGMFF